MTDDPSPIQDSKRLRRKPSDDMSNGFGLAVGLGEDLLLQQEQHTAEDGSKHQQRRRRSIEADAAGSHHNQLAVLRQQPDHDESRNQGRHRDDVVDKLRGRKVEVADAAFRSWPSPGTVCRRNP